MDEPKKAFKKMTTRHPRFGGTIMLALQVIFNILKLLIEADLSHQVERENVQCP